MNIMHRNVTIHNHLLLNWMRTQNKSISNWIGVSGEKGQEAKAELNISDGSDSFFFYFIRNRQTNLYTRWYINRNVNQHFAACISYLFGEKRRKSKPTKFAYIEIDIICRKRDLILEKKRLRLFFLIICMLWFSLHVRIISDDHIAIWIGFSPCSFYHGLFIFGCHHAARIPTEKNI